MQVTIDLGDFWDQDPKVIHETVLGKLVEQVREVSIDPDTYYEARRVVQQILSDEVREAVRTQIEQIVTGRLDDEFTIVTSYGAAGQPTTLRKQVEQQVQGALAAITGGNRNSYPNDMQKRWRDLIDNTVKHVVTEELKPFVSELRAKYAEGFQAAIEASLSSIKAAR